MAKVRIPINPLQKGKVGAYSMYVRKGEQVVRQRRNSSNYGPEASRSLSQQSRRVLWSNLVNFYKQNKAWMPKAFENIKANQTVYNRFMQLNIDKFGVALTKEQAAQGWCFVDNFRVSDGSLPPVSLLKDSQDFYIVGVPMSSSISESSTLGDFSRVIIEESPFYRDGDNIAVVIFEQRYDIGEYPIVVPHYYEVTLDSSSTSPLSDNILFDGNVSIFDSGYWKIVEPAQSPVDMVALVVIHTRKDGGLKVSTQDIVMANTSYVDQYSTADQVSKAIASYGLNVSVPLDPSFSAASIVSVALNGSPVSAFSGKTIRATGQQALAISGRGLSPRVLKVTFEGVSYTPLAQDGGTLTYIIGDNGTARVELDGRFAFAVEVSGVIVPEGLPTTIRGFQKNDTSTSHGASSVTNPMVVRDGNCINYPYTASDDLRYFLFTLELDEALEGDFGGVNSLMINFNNASGLASVNVAVTDVTKPAYITYKGFIVAVFNY